MNRHSLYFLFDIQNRKRIKQRYMSRSEATKRNIELKNPYLVWTLEY